MILEVFGTAFGHFLVGSHNFMITALGSCVKWPLHYIFKVNWGNLRYLKDIQLLMSCMMHNQWKYFPFQ